MFQLSEPIFRSVYLNMFSMVTISSIQDFVQRADSGVLKPFLEVLVSVLGLSLRKAAGKFNNVYVEFPYSSVSVIGHRLTAVDLFALIAGALSDERLSSANIIRPTVTPSLEMY